MDYYTIFTISNYYTIDNIYYCYGNGYVIEKYVEECNRIGSYWIWM